VTGADTTSLLRAHYVMSSFFVVEFIVTSSLCDIKFTVLHCDEFTVSSSLVALSYLPPSDRQGSGRQLSTPGDGPIEALYRRQPRQHGRLRRGNQQRDGLRARHAPDHVDYFSRHVLPKLQNNLHVCVILQ